MAYIVSEENLAVMFEIITLINKEGWDFKLAKNQGYDKIRAHVYNEEGYNISCGSHGGIHIKIYNSTIQMINCRYDIRGPQADYSGAYQHPDLSETTTYDLADPDCLDKLKADLKMNMDRATFKSDWAKFECAPDNTLDQFKSGWPICHGPPSDQK